MISSAKVSITFFIILNIYVLEWFHIFHQHIGRYFLLPERLIYIDNIVYTISIELTVQFTLMRCPFKIPTSYPNGRQILSVWPAFLMSTSAFFCSHNSKILRLDSIWLLEKVLMKKSKPWRFHRHYCQRLIRKRKKNVERFA